MLSLYTDNAASLGEILNEPQVWVTLRTQDISTI